MEKSFEKFLKIILLEKYPIFLDVGVSKSGDSRIDVSDDYKLKECYDVFLVILDKDWKDMENRFSKEVKDFIKDLGKYMDLKVCGIYNYPISEEEWNETQSDEKDYDPSLQ